MPSWDELPEGPDRRLYLTSILGADFGTLSVGDGPNATDSLFTTGAAGFPGYRHIECDRHGPRRLVDDDQHLA